MSYLSEQKTQIAQAQVTEALLRMKKLHLHENAVKEFYEEGKLNKSEHGILYWLDEKEQNMIKEWEKETGCMVYHVILDEFEFGTCYSFLYVSEYSEEWTEDDKWLEQGCPIAYVMNVTRSDYSEFGSIGIRPAYGGVLRIS